MTDETLMAEYAAGDGQAFERLFARVAPRVHRFFLRTFGETALADDLLQVTFLKVHKARRQYRPQLPLLPWLFAVAARVRLDELRRRRRLAEDAGEDDLARAEEAGAEEGARAQAAEAARAEAAEAVRAAIDRLPQSQRVVLHLHRYEGLPLAQVAQVLGTTEGAVKLRAFRAYEKLRQELRPLLAEEGP